MAKKSNWFRKFLKSKEGKRISIVLTRVLAILGVIALLVVFLLFIRWAVGQIRIGIDLFMREQFISRFESQDGAPVGTRLDPEIRDASLVYSSFSDSFSGVGWLNQEETNVYQDRVVTAMTFPPRFEWRRVSRLNVPEDVVLRVGSRRSDGSVLRCLDGRCLVQKGEDIFFVSEEFLASYDNGRYRVELPSVYGNRNVVKVSIGALETRWLVGIVEQRGGEYIGRVYYFYPENEVFEEVSESLVFKSRYQGRIGFGGDDESFLVVYGAYEGQGYHVKEGELHDITRFFGIRVMDDGFEPLVIKQGKGTASTWYVVSNTRGTPKFVKLFQNETEDIVGAVDLTNSLFAGDIESALFYPFRENGDLRGRLVDASGSEEFWEFEDQGFVKTEGKDVVSVNINNYPAEIRYATIDRLSFSDKGADVAFYLSNNEKDWIKTGPGVEVEFPDPKGRQLLWRLEMDPKGSNFVAPYIDKLGIQYWVKFL